MLGPYSADHIRHIVFGEQEIALYEENVMAYRAARDAVSCIQKKHSNLRYEIMYSGTGEDREELFDDLNYWTSASFVAQGLCKHSLQQAKNEVRSINDVSKRKVLSKLITARSFKYS